MNAPPRPPCNSSGPSMLHGHFQWGPQHVTWTFSPNNGIVHQGYVSVCLVQSVRLSSIESLGWYTAPEDTGGGWRGGVLGTTGPRWVHIDQMAHVAALLLASVHNSKSSTVIVGGNPEPRHPEPRQPASQGLMRVSVATLSYRE
jgi:hypothetical protein